MMLAAAMAAVALVSGSVALPQASYDAVVPGLEPWIFGSDASTAWSLTGDATLYAAPGGTAVATLAATNFLDQPTVVVAVDARGDWARVLTPARQSLPSANGGDAAAQTSGWIARGALAHPVPLTRTIVVSISNRTLSIVPKSGSPTTFPVGIGMDDTPTPSGVTGYLQARYFDPAQQQSSHPVQLTSLHSTAADEPFGGEDGGLIGLHYEKDATGAVSHGCVRLGTAAITAVNALPLGTLVTIRP
jgi:hypothetical protein